MRRCSHISMNMLLFSFVLLVLASKTYSQMPVNIDLNPDLLAKLQKIPLALQAKCLKNLDPSAIGELTTSVNKISSCVGEHYSNEASGYCTTYGSAFIKCIEDFGEIAKKCLNADEKYLPKFILDGQKRVLDKFCTADYQNRINKLAGNKCKMPFANLMMSESLSTCFSKLKVLENIDDGVISLTKSEVCSDLLSIQTCIVNTIKTNCKDFNENDLEVLTTIFGEYLVDCDVKSSAAHAVFSTLLLGLSYFVLV